MSLEVLNPSSINQVEKGQMIDQFVTSIAHMIDWVGGSSPFPNSVKGRDPFQV